MGIQVQELTQNLMPWGKEYIDFSFAGRHISEFGMVATTSGDRYTFAASPEFTDETSTVNGAQGQYYWGTNFKTKTYIYNLATDGITERELDDFKRHFRPGNYGQFYEDSNFGRYSYVRVKSIVNFKLLPFQEEHEVAGVKFNGRIYKGDCVLTFIQDLPFQHSYYQVLNGKINNLHTNDDNGEAAIRMMYYNNIPARDSWAKSFSKCSTGSYYSLPAMKKDSNNEYIEISDDNIIFKEGSVIPYYNPSTYNSETEIEFTIKHTTTPINTIEWEPVYFNEIYDSITNKTTPYNTIKTTSPLMMNKQTNLVNPHYSYTFKYSLPEVFSEVNKAIEIAWRLYQENPRSSLAELQERLQEELINGRVLLWAIKVLQKIQINQVLYRPDYSSELIEDGILVDQDLTDEEQKPIEEAAETVLKEIIFHAGDYESEDYNEKEDFPGCLRTGKIKVYTYPVSNKTIEVDWFGYFNLMMLMMFAECSLFESGDITKEGTFSEFYPYTLRFNGEEAQSFVSYKANALYGDGLIEQEEIVEENCSNIVASNYLLVDGGDTIDISTGKLSTYHLLGFNHGETDSITVYDITLKYKYTYA